MKQYRLLLLFPLTLHSPSPLRYVLLLCPYLPNSSVQHPSLCVVHRSSLLLITHLICTSDVRQSFRRVWEALEIFIRVLTPLVVQSTPTSLKRTCGVGPCRTSVIYFISLQGGHLSKVHSRSWSRACPP